MIADFAPLRAALDDLAQAGRQVRFWLRDDDAVAPTAPLDRLLGLGADHGVPLTLAVIPHPTGPALAEAIAGRRVEVAVHGWAHVNHASPGTKSCELGPQRPGAVVLADLAEGLTRLRHLHGDRAQPVLVPPWNRIAPELIPALPGIGFRGLSVFGPERADPPIAMMNAHVDLIDWRGSRGGRPAAALVGDLVQRLHRAAVTGEHVGFLTHHLVHDAAAWRFTDQLLALTAPHPGCRWVALSDLLAGGGHSRVT